MFFRAIGFAIRYSGVIISAVTLVEGLVSRDTPGERKRELVADTVVDLLSDFGVNVTEQTREMIGEIADVAVAILNRLGIFQHAEDRPDDEEFAPASVQAAEEAVDEKEEISENEARLDELEEKLRK